MYLCFQTHGIFLRIIFCVCDWIIWVLLFIAHKPIPRQRRSKGHHVKPWSRCKGWQPPIFFPTSPNLTGIDSNSNRAKINTGYGFDHIVRSKCNMWYLVLIRDVGVIFNSFFCRVLQTAFILTLPCTRGKTKFNMWTYYEGKSILVTGGSGFLGTAIVHRLLTSTSVSRIYLVCRGGSE